MANELPPEMFTQLLRDKAPLLDVRSEGEFLKSGLDWTSNIPILNNLERHKVGICYKENGQSAAEELGHKLVSGALREARVSRWLEEARERNSKAVFCWRGGKRSQIAQQWLLEHGVDLPRIIGGYKALRNHLLKLLPELLGEMNFVVIAGRTGSGKTSFLNNVKLSNKMLDLEGLAKHRGSAFGAVFGEQPSQATFENSLIVELLNLHNHDNRPILIESESRLVGRLALPNLLIDKMQQAPVVVLNVDENTRADNIVDDYIVDNPLCQKASLTDSHNVLREFIVQSTLKLEKRLGKVRTAETLLLIDLAFKEQKNSGDLSRHKDWVLKLLTEYYDPMYEKHLKRYQSRVVLSASPGEAMSYVNSL